MPKKSDKARVIIAKGANGQSGGANIFYKLKKRETKAPSVMCECMASKGPFRVRHHHKIRQQTLQIATTRCEGCISGECM